MKTAWAFALAGVGCSLVAADINVKPGFDLNNIVEPDQTLYRQLFAMQNCTETNGTRGHEGAVAAIYMANTALQNTNQSLYNYWFGSCDKSIVDAVFQAMISAGPDYQALKCVPVGMTAQTNRFLPCDGLGNGWAMTHANPDGSSNTYLCPGVFDRDRVTYPACDSPSLLSNMELGLGGLLLHEFSHRMNVDPAWPVLDGTPAEGNVSCYSAAQVRAAALGDACYSVHIAQAYAFFAAEAHCAAGGTRDAPAPNLGLGAGGSPVAGVSMTATTTTTTTLATAVYTPPAPYPAPAALAPPVIYQAPPDSTSSPAAPTTSSSTNPGPAPAANGPLGSRPDGQVPPGSSSGSGYGTGRGSGRGRGFRNRNNNAVSRNELPGSGGT